MDFMKSLGFIILNPDSNHTALRITTRTINDHYPDAKTVCVIPKNSPELQENKMYARVVEADETITSLLNAGIDAIDAEWFMVVMAGTFLRRNSLKKHQLFCKSDKDILYPVVDFKWAFDEASINGLMMSKKTVAEVGQFGAGMNDFGLIKLLWALEAIAKGYKFKALVGARLI